MQSVEELRQATETRLTSGPVSRAKYFTERPTEKAWMRYKGTITIGLADGTPGLIVPQSLEDLQRLYDRQQQHNSQLDSSQLGKAFTFFEVDTTKEAKLDGSYHGELNIKKTKPNGPKIEQLTKDALKVVEMIRNGTYVLPSSVTTVEDEE